RDVPHRARASGPAHRGPGSRLGGGAALPHRLREGQSIRARRPRDRVVGAGGHAAGRAPTRAGRWQGRPGCSRRGLRDPGLARHPGALRRARDPVLGGRHAGDGDRRRHLRRARDAAELHVSRRHLPVVVLLRSGSRHAGRDAVRAGRGGDLTRAGHHAGAGSGAALALDGGARGVSQGGPLSLARHRVLALAAIVFVSLVTPRAVWSAERANGYVLDWDSGTGKSYVIPAAEIVGFVGALNAFNRLVIDEDTYGTDGHSIWENLHTAPEFDNDPFHVNQIGHPYQGSIYYGLARSAGLNYWESLAATLFGSFLWETAGETTAPSLNDYVTTTLGGSFVGEAAFRMASLLLEGGGETPGFWRELGAAVLSPGLGFNRLVFGDRFKPVFPSHDPAVYIRLRAGVTLTTSVANAHLSPDVQEQDGSLDFYMTYGLPG